jgi:hypothetical protein
MKLWYQSMTREDAWGGYPQALRRILDAVKDPDTQIEAQAITIAIWNSSKPARCWKMSAARCERAMMRS